MRSRLLAVTFEADDPVGPARFWAGLLGREVIEDTGGLLLPGGDAQLGLRFVPGRAGQLGANRMHLHLTSADLDDQRRTVATAVGLGGRHVDVGQRPEEGHIVLADPAGYEFCVIEPGNGYLAGCGPLGELACAGSRQVGLFWSRALGWPLVWDRGEQTAIQSPRGGTKVGWDMRDGPPVAPKTAPRAEPNRQRFELLPANDDQQAAVDVLISLGATRLDAGTDGTVMLADPDGNEFCVRPSGRRPRHHRTVEPGATKVILVDDLRSFVDGRAADVVRTSAAAVELLQRCCGQRVDELWLDHDLGGDDTVWPVVEVLERAAFDDRPIDIGVIYVHSANPAGAAKVAQVLRHWGYRVHIASATPDLSY